MPTFLIHLETVGKIGGRCKGKPKRKPISIALPPEGEKRKKERTGERIKRLS